MRKSTNIPRDNLICIGTCFGKFSKSGKFRMHVTALPYLSKYANVFFTSLVSLLINHQVQSLAEAIWRAIVPVRKPRLEGARIENV